MLDDAHRLWRTATGAVLKPRGRPARRRSHGGRLNLLFDLRPQQLVRLRVYYSDGDPCRCRAGRLCWIRR